MTSFFFNKDGYENDSLLLPPFEIASRFGILKFTFIVMHLDIYTYTCVRIHNKYESRLAHNKYESRFAKNGLQFWNGGSTARRASHIL